MVHEKGRRRLSPYISYRTFLNFIDRLQQGIPARIDRSYLSNRFAGSTGTQLMLALHFLGLIDANGAPTTSLRLLVSARDVRRTEALKKTASEAYGFLLQGSFDLQTATYAQLEEVFYSTFELTGDVCRKCIKFFVALASDAEIALSPFIKQRIRLVHATSGTKTGTKRISERTMRNVVMPQTLKQIPSQPSWSDILVTKFPSFDPTWPDEVKLKWFEAFDELLKRSLTRGRKAG